MSHVTRRSIRRRAELLGKKRKRAVHLSDFFAVLKKEKRPFKLEGNAQGAKIESMHVRGPLSITRIFIHPTKKATEGRMAFVSTAS